MPGTLSRAGRGGTGRPVGLRVKVTEGAFVSSKVYYLSRRDL
jgi:hypothetical protein